MKNYEMNYVKAMISLKSNDDFRKEQPKLAKKLEVLMDNLMTVLE